MSFDSSDQDTGPKVELFWKRYIDVTKRFRIPERTRPWYRKHVQGFIEAHKGVKLQAQTPENVELWLNRLGQSPQLSSWQFRQKVDALRLLFKHMLGLPWAVEFDWDHWCEGGQPLGDQHPTVARSYETKNAGADKPGNFLGQRYPAIYTRFVSAIRISDLSINTEQSYLGWINRFLRFHNKKVPEECADVEVCSFLEYLAVQRKVTGATQAQALNGLVFFFTRALEKPLGEIGSFKRPKPHQRIPTVLTRREVIQILAQFEDRPA